MSSSPRESSTSTRILVYYFHAAQGFLFFFFVLTKGLARIWQKGSPLWACVSSGVFLFPFVKECPFVGFVLQQIFKNKKEINDTARAMVVGANIKIEVKFNSIQ